MVRLSYTTVTSAIFTANFFFLFNSQGLFSAVNTSLASQPVLEFLSGEKMMMKLHTLHCVCTWIVMDLSGVCRMCFFFLYIFSFFFFGAICGTGVFWYR